MEMKEERKTSGRMAQREAEALPLSVLKPR